MGADFPPITLGKAAKDRLTLIDGRHRVEAFRKHKRAKIAATLTMAAEHLWFAEAVRLNTAHGMSLNYQERLSAAMRMFKDKLGDDQVSEAVRIPIAELKQAIAERGIWIKPTDAKPMVVKAPLVRLARSLSKPQLRDAAKHIQETQRGVTGSTAVPLIVQVTDLLEGDGLLRDFDETAAVERLEAAARAWLKGSAKAAAGGR
jgi:hypothetical protein